MAIGAGSGAISSEIVGYTQNATSVGNQGAGVCFIPVSGEGKMSDLSVTGYGDEYGDGEIYCGKLDTYGRTIKRMYWYDLPAEGEYEALHGWFDADGEEDYSNDTLSIGEGLWFTSPSASYKLVSAGKVLPESLPVALKVGNQMLSNPTPIDLTMEQVWVTGYGDEYGDGEIYCGQLDNYGRTKVRMYWYDLPADGEYEALYGWFDADGEAEYNDTNVSVGSSLWFTSPSASYYLNWPSAL